MAKKNNTMDFTKAITKNKLGIEFMLGYIKEKDGIDEANLVVDSFYNKKTNSFNTKELKEYFIETYPEIIKEAEPKYRSLTEKAIKELGIEEFIANAGVRRFNFVRI